MQLTVIGKSLNELYEENPKLFYSHWWKDEAFANEKPAAGEYDIILHDELKNKSFDEQKNAISTRDVTHPAILVEALFAHYKKTGIYLLTNWYVRTNVVVSGGYRVSVGSFGALGLSINRWYGDGPGADMGVSSSRKLSGLEPPETLRLVFSETEIEYKRVI